MKRRTIGSEEARAKLPELLQKAHQGSPTVITKRGRPYAALVPVETIAPKRARTAFLRLMGTGAGLFGDKPGAHVAQLRDEWDR